MVLRPVEYQKDNRSKSDRIIVRGELDKALMDTLAAKTIPTVSTAIDDGMPNNSTADANFGTTTIPGEATETKMTTNGIEKEKNPPLSNNDDEDVEDDDVDDLMDIQIPSSMIVVQDGESSEIDRKRPTAIAPQKPDEDIKIDDRAILDCWDLTVASHDAATTVAPDAKADVAVTFGDNDYRWQAKDLMTPTSTDETTNPDILKNWQPKALSLPPWAVDPFQTSNC